MTPDNVGNAVDAECSTELLRAQLFLGVLKTIRHLAMCKVPMAICLGSQLDACKLKLQNHKEVSDMMSAIVSLFC